MMSRGCWNTSHCTFCEATETSFLISVQSMAVSSSSGGSSSSSSSGSGNSGQSSSQSSQVIEIADGSCRCNQTLCRMLVPNGTCWNGTSPYNWNDGDERGLVPSNSILPLGYRCVSCSPMHYGNDDGFNYEQNKGSTTEGYVYNSSYSGVQKCVPISKPYIKPQGPGGTINELEGNTNQTLIEKYFEELW